MTVSVALTGVTGFVGQFLADGLTAKGYRVRALLRRPSDVSKNLAGVHIGDLERPLNLQAALQDIDYVIHSAGIAHTTGRPEADYRSINTEGTANLAQAAAKAGVKRFIFLSSVQAQTGPSSSVPLTESMPATPQNAYGRSKLAAEKALAASGVEWAALRPALIYGPGVKGNMASLVRLAQSSWPLPDLQAQRSLLALPNLLGGVETLMSAQDPVNRAFLIADDDALSIGQILRVLRTSENRPGMMFPVPDSLIGFLLERAGKSALRERLFENLVVRTDALKALGWNPETKTTAALTGLLTGPSR